MSETKAPEHSPAPTPIRAVYGFVGFILSSVLLCTYFLWALVPDAYLQALGVTFLPQKYWAVAIPIYLSVVFFLFVFVVYPSLGMCITAPVDDIRNVVDEYSKYLTETDRRPETNQEAVPPVSDIPPEALASALRSKGAPPL